MGDGRHADAWVARRLAAVLITLLPSHQRHVREVQCAAGSDGLVGANLSTARYEGGDSLGIRDSGFGIRKTRVTRTARIPNPGSRIPNPGSAASPSKM
jgi:hypothetical protein